MENHLNNSKRWLICPAGKIYPRTETVATLLQEYTLDDVVDAVKHEKQLFYEKDNQKWWMKVKPPKKRLLPDVFGGPVESRFQTLISDLKETVTESYWRRGVGKRADVNPLPLSITTPPETITFGKPTAEDEGIKELLNYCWYLDEPTPREKVLAKRKTLVYPVRRMKCQPFAYNPRGMCMRECMNWVADKFTVGGSILADFQETYCSKLEHGLIVPKPLLDDELQTH